MKLDEPDLMTLNTITEHPLPKDSQKTSKDIMQAALRQNVKNFNLTTKKRNKEAVIVQKKNDATKQVIKHADMMIKLAESGVVPKQEMVFDFGKRKQKAPMESFTAYYLYKTEEMENAKRLLRKQQLEANSGGIGNDEEAHEEDRVVLSPREIFSKYVSDSHFSDPDRFITEE